MLFVWVCVFVSAFTGRFVTGQSPPPLPPGSPQEVPVVQGLNYFLEMLLDVQRARPATLLLNLNAPSPL
ncbi:hypothetical protein FQN60_018718, partial [Etheostoma spectabile]